MSDTPRDCEHGQLARSCRICELERDLAAAINKAEDAYSGNSILNAENNTLQRRINKLAENLAALLEENAKLKRHAEEMAHKLENDCDAYTADPISAYRADFPKE